MSDRSQFISLFEEHRQARQGASSVFLSGLCHGLGAGLLWFGLLHAPRIRQPLITDRYSVRHLDLHSSELNSNRNDNYYPHPDQHAKKVAKGADPNQPSPALPDLENAVEAKQTLVQPKIQTQLAMEAPIPTVVVWTPEKTPTERIVAPSPDKPTSVEAKPSLQAPNEELEPGAHPMTSVLDPPKAPTPPPGTTTPMVVHAQAVLHLAPATTSNSQDAPTPTALLSLTDLRMTDGTIVLPPANQVHVTLATDARVPDAKAGDPNASESDQGGSEPGKDGEKSTGAAGLTTQHIQMAKDGKFGVIVVGTSLADQYPQTLQIWSDRVAYTAYLHVGLAKNWILQYAQLRSVEEAANGKVARLEAPWPYDIMRPNLVSSDLNADALMVHGILNEAGQLTSLAVAFPQQFAQAAFVLQALEKWQFRPALQQGKPTAVEVLLIIPDELD